MKSKWFVMFALLMGTQAHAFEQIEANIKYPVGMGATSSGYTSMIGFGAAIYFPPLLDPAIPNFLSAGFQTYRLRADNVSALRMIPIIAGIEIVGKAFSDFNTTFGVGAGVTASYVSVTSQTSYSWSAYFTTQIKPGFEWAMSEDIKLVGHTPVTMFIARSFMSSMDFDLGVKFKL